MSRPIRQYHINSDDEQSQQSSQPLQQWRPTVQGLTQRQCLTMSSREIAELTGKRHDNVMADIRAMLGELGLTSPEFSGHLPDAYGRPQPVFNLPEDLTMTLVAGYSAPLRHRIVTRWMELEAQALAPAQALPNFMNPAEAARAWAAEFDGRTAAQAQVLQLEAENRQQGQALAEVAPKAEALDRIATRTDGALNLTEAAKVLGLKRRDLVSHLLERGGSIAGTAAGN